MTEEELKEIMKKDLDEVFDVKNIIDFHFDLLRETYIKGLDTGLKAGRGETKWHKVADGDLPKRVDDYVTNIGVLTYDHYGNGVYKWHTPFCKACAYADEVSDNEVIAWCEIPKYTEE